jgi:hypothetical protein
MNDVMKMNKGEISDKDLYLIKFLSQILFDLLDGISAGLVFSFNEHTGVVYILLCEELEKLTDGKFIRPFKTLFAVGKDIDIEWNEDEKWKCLDELSEFDTLFIKRGKKRFDINDYEEKYRHLIIDALKEVNEIKTLNKAQKKLVEEENFNGEPFTHEGSFIKDRWCSFENHKFFIHLNDGSPDSLPFSSDISGNLMYEVFRVLFETWRRSETDEGFVFVDKETILKGLEAVGIKGKNGDDLKNIMHNLRTKIKHYGLSSTIILNHFSEIEDGYPFKIIVPLTE